MSWLRAVGNWFDERLLLRATAGPSLTHPVPRRTASWWYVFGSGTLVCFIVQVATGICLALVYVPSAGEAWDSLIYLNYQQALGWYLRAVHLWGSHFMVALMALHMTQVFLFGAFKYPRELTWIVGVFLLLATLGMAFTGQVLRWDQDAYWGLGIGAAMIGRVPFIGANLVYTLLGGAIIAGETLSRFFALHVFILPGIMIALIGIHLLLVLRMGINEIPEPGKLVEKATYREEYKRLVKRDGVPFFPVAATKDMVFAGIVILAILVCAALFGPKGPGGQPDPTLIDTVPRPDFYFMWIFAVLALLPPSIETILILTVPVLGVLFLILIPFVFGTGEKDVRRRPVAALSVVTIFLGLGTLTLAGIRSPWSPEMHAWSADPIPVDYLRGRSPLELQGALVIQEKQCRNCHSLGGEGGRRGPALDGVGNRFTQDLLIRQVLQGGGNMPAFGKHLSPPEVTAVVAFMETLRTGIEPPARSSIEPATPEAAVDSAGRDPAADPDSVARDGAAEAHADPGARESVARAEDR